MTQFAPACDGQHMDTAKREGIKPKVALITLVDHRDEFYALRAPLAEAEMVTVRTLLGGEVEIVLDVLVRKNEAARAAGHEARRTGADVLLLHTPIWAPPNLGLVTARIAGLPVGILANTSLATSGLPGLLSLAATLDQVGIPHRRFFGDLADQSFRGKVLAFCRAAATRSALVGNRLGLLGGFGVGLYSAGFDPGQWQRIFGVETVHQDQMEIVRRAEEVPEAEVDRFVQWLVRRVGRIELGAPTLTPAHLARQIRSYLATRALANEMGYDFLALKCQPELSDGYALQCLNVALLNDPYDADGLKPPLPCSCEADADGALTMRILNLLSGGAPTALLDVRGFLPKEGILVLANCGAMATYFAGRSQRAEENLAKVHVLPHVFGRAGGGTTQFVAAPGPITLARLCRRNGRYWMAVMAGEAVAKPREDLRQSTYVWPHAFVKTRCDFAEFVAEYGANHFLTVAGDWRDELSDFCRLLELDYHDYTGGE
ncbi:MAG: hypothetical protein GX493_12370 [Firmicutes bacterium]|nr:hypothetical protein [Bacillota bacterium]